MNSTSALRRPTRLLAAVMFAAALFAGCAAGTPGGAPGASGSTAAPPASTRLVPTQPPADIGVIERFAWQTVVQLADALEAGDNAGFLGKVSRGFYRGYSVLEESLQAFSAAGVDRDVVVAVQEVRIEAERLSVRARWTHDVDGSTGLPSARSGETTFLFLKSETALRLLDYRGDAPFGIPGI